MLLDVASRNQVGIRVAEDKRAIEDGPPAEGNTYALPQVEELKVFTMVP